MKRRFDWAGAGGSVVVLAGLVFREHLGRRVLLALALMTLGGVALSLTASGSVALSGAGVVAVVLALFIAHALLAVRKLQQRRGVERGPAAPRSAPCHGTARAARPDSRLYQRRPSGHGARRRFSRGGKGAYREQGLRRSWVDLVFRARH